MRTLIKRSAAKDPTKVPVIEPPKRPPIPSINRAPSPGLGITMKYNKPPRQPRPQLQGVGSIKIGATMKNRRSNTSWEDRAAAWPAATASAGLLNHLGVKGVLATKHMKPKKELTKRLIEVAKREGVSPEILESDLFGPGGFQPGVGVHRGTGFKYRPSIVAHELGHAKDYGKLTPEKALKNIQLKARLAAAGRGLGTIGAAFVPDQYSLPTALGGLALSAPQLTSEVKASYYGGKMLAKALENKGLMRRLGARISPFLGVPTYAALASTPLMAYGLRKKLKNVFK